MLTEPCMHVDEIVHIKNLNINCCCFNTDTKHDLQVDKMLSKSPVRLYQIQTPQPLQPNTSFLTLCAAVVLSVFALSNSLRCH